MNPKDVTIIAWPPRKTGGMQTGEIPKGIRVEHEPTGAVVECIHLRHQGANKDAAMAVLELLVEQ